MKTQQTSSSNLLIVFVKNPVVGQVKTRLAKLVGDFTAFKIYLDLLFRTHNAIKDICCDKAVFYSNFIDNDDLWENDSFLKSRQYGNQVNERLLHAFQFALNSGYKKVLVVFSDIVGLKKEILSEAMDKLDYKDVVLGPSSDGGYYLIGMKSIQPDFFSNIAWYTPQVLAQTISKCQNKALKYSMTKVLTDLNTIENLDLLDITDRSRYKMMILNGQKQTFENSQMYMH